MRAIRGKEGDSMGTLTVDSYAKEARSEAAQSSTP